MVVEVKNPNALRDPRVEAFLRRGFAAVDGAGYGEHVVVALWRELQNPETPHGLLVDLEGSELRGFVLLDGYTGPLRTYGWLTHFYATSAAARRRLLHGLVAWFHARGVYHVRAANGSGASDAAFVRVFTGAGVTARRVTSVYEFTAEVQHGERRFVHDQDARHHA